MRFFIFSLSHESPSSQSPSLLSLLSTLYVEYNTIHVQSCMICIVRVQYCTVHIFTIQPKNQGAVCRPFDRPFLTALWTHPHSPNRNPSSLTIHQRCKFIFLFLFSLSLPPPQFVALFQKNFFLATHPPPPGFVFFYPIIIKHGGWLVWWYVCTYVRVE